ncbi:cytochrome c oxidase assembly protein COX16 homolog, mitochondrial isoform X1 [Antennarius striatus]|uniref:cytochrome c oxidase assembly protein COX16 homolog, mitochondrial isoform X1 n=1 Tax=Antennarius striatus TaxID=241820 RepID=UPI0035AEC51B
MFNLKALKKSKTLKYGLPMLVLVVGGSFGLREFSQIRYDEQRINRRLDPSLEARVNVRDQSVVLEEEYEKMKTQKLDEWKNIRGPRPWEDSREYQNQQRARLDQKHTTKNGIDGTNGQEVRE